MFRRSFFFFNLLIVLTGFAIYWFHIRLEEKDGPNYHNLVKKSSELRARKTFEETPAFQVRQGVQKDIWTNNQTRHFQIQSDYSELTFLQKKGKMEAVETLKNLSLESDFILTADEGVYSYPPHEFTATQNCHLLKGANSIGGTRMHFDLTDEIVTYDNPQGRLKTGLEFTAGTMIWNRKEDKIYLNNQVTIHDPEQSTLTANKGVLTLNDLEPDQLELFGSVHLISTKVNDKESYAIADYLKMRPTQKTILLTAEKNVLFWQEGLSMSAPEILIKQNQTVEGHGDVHFNFNLEEKNFIEELLKQYL